MHFPHKLGSYFPFIMSDLSDFWAIKLHGIPVWPFALIGAYYAVHSVGSFLFGVVRNVATRLVHFNNFRGLGSWAVVTGATDGIGLAYAEQLAKKGMNIMLISRTEEKLAAVAKKISEDCPDVQVRWIAADFTKLDIYERIEEELKDLDIGVLVNNVGKTCDHIDYFWETKREFVQSMLNINIHAMVMMTHIVMPKMASKNRGLIVNIASVLGEIPPYLFIMYGTTKNFMKYFSYGLQLECKRACPGVIVQDVCPGFVATKLARRQGQDSLFVIDPTRYVNQTLKTIGLPSTHGHLVHDIEFSYNDLIPKYLNEYLAFWGAELYRKYDKKKTREMLEMRSKNE